MATAFTGVLASRTAGTCGAEPRYGLADLGSELRVPVRVHPPYQPTRERLRERLGTLFHGIYIKRPIEIRMERDPKQHYRKARQGCIVCCTGGYTPYEPPMDPNLCVETALRSIEASVKLITESILHTLPAKENS